MPEHLLTKTVELVSFCKACAGAPFITVDTEFLREKTYFPKLCLIQIGVPAYGGRDAFQVAIDALSPDVNLTPLESLFFNQNMVKVFHAARQDLEIMTLLFDGRVPAPLFDTQVAAMVCGHGDQIGYQNLVKNICFVTLDKSNQYTDWSRRPLSKDQVTYALGDVTYLRDIYIHLKGQIERENRWFWVEEEMRALENPGMHSVNPDEVWQRIKIKNDKPKVLAVLKALAAWREREAMNRDRPRLFILKDEVLCDLAQRPPKRQQDLEEVRGLPEKYCSGAAAENLMKIIDEALISPKESWPQKIEKPVFPQELVPALEMLKMLLKIQAAAHGLVPRLIAQNEDLEAFIQGDSSLNMLQGWRYDLFGKQAEALLSGDIALKLKDNHIVIQME
jgi:ribonuclease D